MDLLPSVAEQVAESAPKKKALARARGILETLESDLQKADWYHEGWLEEKLQRVDADFDETCERWRSLYRSASDQRDRQNRIIGDASRSQKEKETAKRLRRQAEAQVELLLETDSLFQSDFYSYRYFASEGFLPGYNFPRLPLSAYLPGRARRKGRDEFLSRPRFLAISEFGPRSIIYHEGSRYLINQVILQPTKVTHGLGKSKYAPHAATSTPSSKDPVPISVNTVERHSESPIASCFGSKTYRPSGKDESTRTKRKEGGLDTRSGQGSDLATVGKNRRSGPARLRSMGMFSQRSHSAMPPPSGG